MIRRAALFLALPIALVLAGVAYTVLMGRFAPGTPPAMAPRSLQADAIAVDKSARTLTLLRDGAPLRQYPVALGSAPLGPQAARG